MSFMGDGVQLWEYENLEVVYLHKPLGLPVGERALRQVKVLFREGQMQELNNLVIFLKKLVLFVMTPQQYMTHVDTITAHMEGPHSSGNLAFLLVEDPADVPTLRLRKKIEKSATKPWVIGDVRGPTSFNTVWNEISKACHTLYLNATHDVFSSMMAIRDVEARAINEISIRLADNSSSVDELLELILQKAVELSVADAGFLLLRENLFGSPDDKPNEDKVKILRQCVGKLVLKAKVTRSQKNLRLKPEIFSQESSDFTSIVIGREYGVSWYRGREFATLRHPDSITQEMDVSMPELDFDPQTYSIKSHCAFPLRTPSSEVVGFILLVNRRISPKIYLDNKQDVENYVTEFSTRDLNILEALANQSGVSIDHTRLIRDLKTVFESFVYASVTAIESRDPTTRGHSERVAVLSVGIAEAVNRISNGSYGNVFFSPTQVYELRYAALLHDFGKIGVREDVLRKEKKLYPHEIETIRSRFLNINQRLQIRILEHYMESLMQRQAIPTSDDREKIRTEIEGMSRNLNKLWESIVSANEPHVVNTSIKEKIQELKNVSILGENFQLLSEEECQKLSISRGSLSAEERIEIESHVTHSYRFLIKIPWTQDLANIPEIVYAHHERLNGKGYPRNLTEEDIPVQAKIMAIADVYDALVAMDRPYKKAIPHERALAILDAEVRDGKLDGELFEIFTQARVGDLIRTEENRAA